MTALAMAAPNFPSSPFQHSSPFKHNAFASSSQIPSSPLTPNRKRPASPSSPSTPTAFAHEFNIKRRRPNLSHGFSGLAIGPRSPSPLPTYDESEKQMEEEDEEELIPAQMYDPDDVTVEVLPDQRGSSQSATSEDTSDSDVTFRQPRRRRHARVAQQADEIEQPPEVESTSYQKPSRYRKRRASGIPSSRKRPRGDDIDMDKESDDQADTTFIDSDIEEIPRSRKMQWHEPEKDRIVVTNLGSPSSSRSSSPDSDRHLEQPGNNGFTLNPSLLTHLLYTQRNQYSGLSRPSRPEKGLIIYRPVGIYPGVSDEVVQQWQGFPQVAHEDATRFEVLEDDMEPMRMGMGVEEDVSMDME